MKLKKTLFTILLQFPPRFFQRYFSLGWYPYRWKKEMNAL